MDAVHALLVAGALILVGGAATNTTNIMAMMNTDHEEDMMGMQGGMRMSKMMGEMAMSMEEMMDTMNRTMAAQEAVQEEQSCCPCPSGA